MEVNRELDKKPELINQSPHVRAGFVNPAGKRRRI